MDKIPGILILIGVAVILYILFFGWRRKGHDGEASRTKYILVWFLFSFLSNIFVNLFSSIWGTQLPYSILKPDENIITFCIFYVVGFICSYFIFIFTYSLFKNLIRKKVIPFVWLSSVLGILVAIGQMMSLRYLHDDYPNYLSYNITATIIAQIAVIFLILRWIKANPGFTPLTASQPNSPPQKTEPELPKLNRTNETTSTPKEPRLSSKNFKLDNVDNTTISEINKTKISDERKDELLKEEEHSSSVKQEISSEDQDDTPIIQEPTLSTDSSATNPEFLKDEIYAASKFGDISQLISLLKADGFEIKKNSGQYSLKTQDGSETMLSNDSELINFGKRYARS